MPLEEGYREETIGRNIAELKRSGYSEKHAADIAYGQARRTWKKANPGRPLPMYLQRRR